jgi:hypothetical protein
MMSNFHSLPNSPAKRKGRKDMSEGYVILKRCDKIEDTVTAGGSRQSSNYHYLKSECFGCRVEELEKEITTLKAAALELSEALGELRKYNGDTTKCELIIRETLARYQELLKQIKEGEA